MAVISTIEAGPLNTRPRRMIRDVYSEFDSQSQNITQPTAGVCLHDGVAVPETSVVCVKKAGCRAIQKTGYCCPDYQCDCERNGKIYANGEKLVDPEDPCKGCYCQGGEILCNKVNCYIRHDCEPKFIAGRCCPEYDNCPPIDSGRPALTSSTTASPEASASTSGDSNENPVSSAPTLASNKQQEMLNNNPLGIKIKEITKPEEIRIIDEKPKQTYQIIKPFESNGSNQPKIYAPTAPRIEPIAPQPPTVLVANPVINSPPNTVEIDDEQVPAIASSILASQDAEAKKTTSAEKSPSTVETSTEPINKLESAEGNSITDEDTLKIVRHTDSVQMDQASAENASIATNVSDSEKDVPGTGGKEVVIVDSNGQTKPITVFGVEGLQRGDELDEVLEYDEKKTASKRSDVPQINLDISTEGPGDHSTAPELIYENSSSTGQSNPSDFKTVSEVDPIGSSSDDVIRIALTSDTLDSTTEGLSVDGRLSTSNSSEVFETVYQTLDNEDSDVEDSQAHGSVFHTVYREPDEIAPLVAWTEGPKVAEMDAIESDDHDADINPAYPKQSDDLSIYQTQVRAEEENMSAKDEKILPDILDLLSNSTYSYNSTTVAPESWLKQNGNSSTTEGMPIDDETALIPQERSPGEPLLIPEWERNTTESTTQNSTSSDESLEEEALLPNGEATELDSIASGDGPAKKFKERESTTPNVRRLIDIDEDGSGGLEHHPKDDIESLKIQDGSGDSSTYLKPYLDSSVRSFVNVLDDFWRFA